MASVASKQVTSSLNSSPAVPLLVHSQFTPSESQFSFPDPSFSSPLFELPSVSQQVSLISQIPSSTLCDVTSCLPHFLCPALLQSYMSQP